MQTQRLTLEELELSSFVTSLPEEEQMAIVGACPWWASWAVIERIRDGIKRYWDWVHNLPAIEYATPPFETNPGFFDTDYPCG